MTQFNINPTKPDSNTFQRKTLPYKVSLLAFKYLKMVQQTVADEKGSKSHFHLVWKKYNSQKTIAIWISQMDIVVKSGCRGYLYGYK